MRSFFAVIATVSAFATAALGQAMTIDNLNEFCGAQGRLAEKIMEHRQHELPLSSLIASLQSDKSEDRFTRQLYEVSTELAIAAYKMPGASVESVNTEIRKRFRNDAEVACYERNKHELSPS